MELNWRYFICFVSGVIFTSLCFYGIEVINWIVKSPFDKINFLMLIATAAGVFFAIYQYQKNKEPEIIARLEWRGESPLFVLYNVGLSTARDVQVKFDESFMNAFLNIHFENIKNERFSTMLRLLAGRREMCREQTICYSLVSKEQFKSNIASKISRIKVSISWNYKNKTFQKECFIDTFDEITTNYDGLEQIRTELKNIRKLRFCDLLKRHKNNK